MTTALIANVGVVDISKANGATVRAACFSCFCFLTSLLPRQEVWPGSHLVAECGPLNKYHAAEDHETAMEELTRQRRAVAPPTNAPIPKGGVLFRDARVWHKGVPNPSARVRHMLALLYSARSVRDVTIANATNLNRGEQPTSTMFNDDRIQLDGSGMPLRELVFSESCAEVLRAPSRFGVDRNATFWPGAIDYIGRPVEASRARAPREAERPLPQWARDALRAPRL